MLESSFYIYLFKSFLVIHGKRGRFVVDLNLQLTNCFLIIQNSMLFLIDYKKEVCGEKLISLLRNGLKGIHHNFSKKLNLVGIGFRCWTVSEGGSKFLIVKTSLSKDCILFIPKVVDVFCLTPTTIFITGVRQSDVNLFVSSVKKIKKPNFYKQKGIFLENEVVKVKVGKKM